MPLQGQCTQTPLRVYWGKAEDGAFRMQQGLSVRATLAACRSSTQSWLRTSSLMPTLHWSGWMSEVSRPAGMASS